MTQSSFTPIAIVGRSCVLPGALTPEALWALSAEARHVFSALPARRLSRHRMQVAPASSIGGYIQGFEGVFQPERYPLDADFLQHLDPVFLWTLHVARTALDEAGISDAAPRTGIVLGNLSYPTRSMVDHAYEVWASQATGPWKAFLDAVRPKHALPENRFMSGLPALLVAETLGLDGQAFALDAACASGLYALNAACEALHSGAADVMLAAAVNAADRAFIHRGFQALGAISPSGRSRPFCAEADGLLPAEGAACVVLKRLDEAVAAGDRVFGVIRGIGLSNDGRGHGFLAPSTQGQERALRSAYAGAGLEPSTVSFVECHATGTARGDAVELETLQAVFGHRNEALPIASLKSNIGHSITVAGLAGLLRTLSALQDGNLPPTLGVENQHSAFAGSLLRPVEQLESWPVDGPRRAGVNAFGFGGNNAHAIVEAYEPTAKYRLPAALRSEAKLACVAVGVSAGGIPNSAIWAEQVRDGKPCAPGKLFSLSLDWQRLNTPPKDLEAALLQQTMLLAAAEDALQHIELPGELAPESVGVFVGMSADVGVCSYGLRQEFELWSAERGLNLAWVELDAIAEALTPAHVVGCMPNIPANRLSQHLGVSGPSFTLSAEDDSGTVALRQAAVQLRTRQIDAAWVGASDVTSQPVHKAACRSLGVSDAFGDAAVLWLLVRLDDAKRWGLPVIVEVSCDDGPPVQERGPAASAVGALWRLTEAAFGISEGQGASVAGCALRYAGGTPSGRTRAVDHDSTESGVPPLVLEQRAEPRDPLAEGRFSPDAEFGSPMTLAPPPLLPAVTLAPASAAVELAVVPPVPLAPQPTSSASPLALVPAPRGASAEVLALYDDAVQLWHRQQMRMLSHQREGFDQFVRLWEHGADLLKARYAEASRAAATVACATGVPEYVRTSVPEYASPLFDRQQLEIHSNGRLAELFGADFASIDAHQQRVRMPEPPLLLADRVMALDAAPLSLGKGSVITETDVLADAWYLHEGHVPAGVVIEAGQADLFLISYLGADALNRGDRVYRLLGCDLTYRNGLPATGDTLRYDIHVDGHAQQGETRLFFFHSDCRVNGSTRLEVRNGQAGFFSDAELEASGGVLWSAEEEMLDESDVVPEFPFLTEKTQFSQSDVDAFAQGELTTCFGPSFRRGLTHTMTPRIPADRMRLFDEVPEFLATGGPWGRGYLRARRDISPDDWFFEGHFTNDPCMPGTLMFEGCLQTLAFYLTACGFTLARDGFRFEPLPDTTFQLRCRGQVTPRSRELVYEVFVRRIATDPQPTIHADVLCTVDGLKAFWGHGVALHLVPDWPQGRIDESSSGARVKSGSADKSSSGARVKDFVFNHHSLLATAYGKPSDAFGPIYSRYDSGTLVPRLPSPPYHFMSRVVAVEGDHGVCAPGARVTVEYDIPGVSDVEGPGWFFNAYSGTSTSTHSGIAEPPTMPFCVFLEALLQPCGWLASYVGSTLSIDEPLFFRNLDGRGDFPGLAARQLQPYSGTLRTHVELTKVARSGSMLIESFAVRGLLGDRVVADFETVFGFFPAAALADQRGLPAASDEVSDAGPPNLSELSEAEAKPRFQGAHPRLHLIDRVLACDPRGGAAQLGRIWVESDVRPDAWFFKAHFYRDPVQPGSLGLEMLQQALGELLVRQGIDPATVRFHGASQWTYRGQVIPENRQIRAVVEIVGALDGSKGTRYQGRGELWVDGKRIYSARLGTGLATSGAP